MVITVISSGSRGNAYKLESSAGTTLLLECGLPYGELQKKLKYRIRDVDACLITHEHLDHAKSVMDLLKSGVDVYMSRGTADALQVYGLGHRVHLFTPRADAYEPVDVGDFLVIPMRAVHDAEEPVSYYIKSYATGERLLFVTDTAYMPYMIPPNINYLMVECNYVKEILDAKTRAGEAHVSLRNRIVQNHMSLETLLKAIESTEFTNLKKIYLLHLSDANSDQQYIYDRIARLTGKQICFS